METVVEEEEKKHGDGRITQKESGDKGAVSEV